MFNKGELMLNGWSLTPNQIFAPGSALIEIGTDNDGALRAEIIGLQD